MTEELTAVSNPLAHNKMVPMIEATFKRLSVLLRALSSEGATAEQGSSNRFIQSTSKMISTFTSPSQLYCVLDNFNRCLYEFKGHSVMYFLIVKMFDAYFKSLGDIRTNKIYSNIITKPLLAELLYNLLRGKSCYETRVIISIYLNITFTNAANDLNAAMHRNSLVSCDHYLDNIFKSLGVLEGKVYLACCHDKLYEILNSKNTGQDAILAFADSKLKYGYLELLNLVHCSSSSLPTRIAIISTLLDSVTDSPIFSQIYIYFNCLSILEWCHYNARDYVPVCSKNPDAVEVFNKMYEVLSDSKITQEGGLPSVLNNSSLSSILLLNTEIFEKFEQYTADGRKAPSLISINSGLSLTERKMFAILVKITTPENTTNIDEKHLILKTFTNFLIAAASVRISDPDYPVIRFVKKYYKQVLGNVKDVLNTLSTSVMENPVLEYNKIQFWANYFALMPDEVFEEISKLIDYFNPQDLYSYYNTVGVIKALGEIPGGIPIIVGKLLNAEFFVKFLERGLWTCKIMEETRAEYSKIAHRISLQKADLSDSSIYEVEVKMLKSSSNQYSMKNHHQNGKDHTKDQEASLINKKASVVGLTNLNSNSESSSEVEHSSILGNQGYLSRKIYETSINFIGLAPQTVLTLDPNIIPDVEFCADEELRKKNIDMVITQGPNFTPIALAGLFDPQFGAFETVCNLLSGFLGTPAVVDHHVYYVFLYNIEFIRVWLKAFVAQPFGSIQNNIHRLSYLLKYLVLYFDVYAPKADLKLIFKDINSPNTDKFVALCEAFEEFIYVFLCSGTPEAYIKLRNLVTIFVKYFSKDSEIAILIRTKVNWKFMVAISKDSELLIKSQRFLQKKVTRYFSENIEHVTVGLNSAVIKAIENFKELCALKIVNKTQLLAFSSNSVFLGVALGFYNDSDDDKDLKLLSEQYIEALLSLLKSDEPQKKTMAEDTIGKDAHPNLLGTVFYTFRDAFEKFQTRSETAVLTSSETDIILTYAGVLERLFKRLPGPHLFRNSSPIVRISEYFINLVKNQYRLLATKTGYELSNNAKANVAVQFARTKLAAVRLVHTSMRFSKETRVDGLFLYFKNDVLKTVLHWLEVAFFKDEPNFFVTMINSSSTARPETFISAINNGYREIVIEISSLMVIVTKELAIIRRHINSDKEAIIFKTIMFGNYYNVLIRIFKKCLYDMKDKVPIEKPVGKLSFHPLDSIGDLNKLELQKMVENTITCIGNLTKANYEVAYNYILPLITDENPLIKDAFMQIFKHIFFIQSKARERQLVIESENFHKFCWKGLSSEPLLIAIRKSISNIDIDRVTTPILVILESGGILFKILKALINYELKTCLKPLDILRRNNLTTKLLSSVGKKFGGDYLKNTIGEVLDQIIVNEDYFEVDQFYQTDDIISNEDSGKFFHYFTKLVNSICESANDVPPILRTTCYILRTCVESFTKDRELSLIIIGTFFFLRFLCPAIAYPEELDLINYEPTPEAKRCFILLTKALQNASNGTLNIEKFPLLKGKEFEMQALVNKIYDFVDAVSSIDLTEQALQISGAPRKFDPNLFKIVYTFIMENAEEIRGYMASPTALPINQLENMYTYYDAVSRFFSLLGPISLIYRPQVAEFIRYNKSKYLELYESINRSLKDPMFETILDSDFFTESVAKDGTQVFALTLSKFESLGVQPMLIFSRIVQAISRVSTSNYSIVMNGTLFNNKIKGGVVSEVMDLLSKLVPDELSEKCIGVSCINISSVFANLLIKRFELRAKEPYKFLNPLYTKLTFLSSFEDSRIISSFNLSEWSYSISSDGKNYDDDDISYVTIEEKTGQPKKSFAQLRLTKNHVIYSIGEPLRLQIGRITKAVKVVNFEPLSDWIDIKEVGSNNNSNKSSQIFSVYSKLLKKNLTFISPKSNEIIRVIYLNLTGHADTIYDPNSEWKLSDRKTDANEILGGVFLIMSSGLLSYDESVRKNAYSLLHVFEAYLADGEVSETLNIGNMFSPPRSHATVKTISCSLAKKYPHLTKQIISAFIYIHHNNEAELDFADLFLILEPWIGYIYSYVYLKEIDGADLVRSFISAVVESVPAEKTNLMTLNEQVWRSLVEVDLFVDIIVDEVIKECLNRQTMGIEYQNLIGIVAMNPSLKVCDRIMKLLVESSNIRRSLKGQKARIVLYWGRVSLLLKIAVSFFFGRVYFVEKFLPEILYVISLFHRCGPKHVKTLIRELSINMLNTLAVNPGLSKESSERLLQEAEPWKVTSSKSVFGINDSENFYIYDVENEQSTTEFHLDYFASKVICERAVAPLTIPEYQNIGLTNIWAGKILKLVSRTINEDDGIFQIKGSRLFGHVANLGAQDLLVHKYFGKLKDYLAQLHSEHFSLATFATFSSELARFSYGLHDDSAYFNTFIFFALICYHYDNILMFEVSFLIIGSTMITMFNRNLFNTHNIWGMLAQDTESAYPLMQKYFTRGQLSLTTKYEMFFVHLITKALTSPMSRGALYKVGSHIVTIRVLCAKKSAMTSGAAFDSEALCCLVPFFIAINDPEEFKAILLKAGFIETFIGYTELGGPDKIPTMIIECLLLKNPNSLATLICISNMFCLRNLDLRWKNRYLKLLRYLGNKNREVIEFVFPIISKACYDVYSAQDASLEMVSIIDEIQSVAAQIFGARQYQVKNPVYKFQKFLEDQELDENSLSIEYTDDICFGGDKLKQFKKSKLTVCIYAEFKLKETLTKFFF